MIVTVLIFAPLVLAGLLLATPRSAERATRWIAFLGSLFVFLLSLLEARPTDHQRIVAQVLPTPLEGPGEARHPDASSRVLEPETGHLLARARRHLLQVDDQTTERDLRAPGE